MQETQKIKALIDDAHQIIVNPERQRLSVTIQSGVKRGTIGGTITGATALGAEAVGFTGVGAITAFNAQATMASGLYAGGIALMPPVVAGAVVGVMTGAAIKYSNNRQDRLDLSDVVDHALNGRSTRDRQTWTERSGLKKIVNPKDEKFWKALMASPKLADLDYEDRKKIIDKIPVNKPEIIDALITQKHFETMIPQHSATVYCKILQIDDKKVRADRIGFFNTITAIKDWETTHGSDSINLDRFKSALNIALEKNTKNSLFPIHTIFRDIKNNSEDAVAKWDFLDTECEELISKMDQKNILNYDPEHAGSLSPTDLNDFKNDIHDLTKRFYNFYNNGKVVDPKTDPDHKLRQALSYTQEYDKKIRKTEKRFAKDKADIQRQINEKTQELKNKKRDYPEYIKQSTAFEKDKKQFEELYNQSPQTPEDRQRLNANLHALETKYQAYANPPHEIKTLNDDLSRLQTKLEKYGTRQPHVTAGLNIARFVMNNIEFIGNQFMSGLEAEQATQASIIGNVTSGIFKVATGTSPTDAILSRVDDASINDRKERLRKIFDTSNDIPVTIYTIDDIDNELNRLNNPPTNPNYQPDPQDIIGKIKTPQKVLHEFLDNYGNNDKSLLNLSAGGLKSLTETVLSTAFDQEFPSRDNFNLLIKLINKAPKEMFAQGGFFAGERTLHLTNIASDLLELEAYDAATEFMSALLPKIHIEKNKSNTIDERINDNFSKIVALSLNATESGEISAQRPIELLMTLAESNLASNDIIDNKTSILAGMLVHYDSWVAHGTLNGMLPEKRSFLLKRLINKMPKEKFDRKSGFFRSEHIVKLIRLTSDLLELGHTNPATEFMEGLLPKISIKDYDSSCDIDKKIFDSFSKMSELALKLSENDIISAKKPLLLLTNLAKKDISNYNSQNRTLEILTKSLLEVSIGTHDPYTPKFNLVKQLIDNSPKEIFEQGGYLSGEKTAVLTEIMSDLLELGHVKPATEFMQGLLPKIDIQNYNGTNPEQKHIFDNLSKITELSIDMSQVQDMPIEPLEMLLYQTKKDIYKTVKNQQELVNHPVLNHIDSISQLASQNVRDRNYKIFDDLIDIVRISNKYEQNEQKQISTNTVFGIQASPIMNTLIAQSKTMFGTIPKKQILKFLKTCKKSDFAKDGILEDSIEQLKHYTKTASPEMQKAILNTNFKNVYHNIFIRGFKKLQRNLYGLKQQISDDASFSSLDSDKVRPNTPINRTTQTPYSRTPNRNMAI